MPQHITTEYGQTIHHVWDVAEYSKFPHSRRWYIGAGIFLVACLAYALWDENYLFAFILLLITVIFAFHEMREPAVTQFGITDRGVVWRGFLYPYKEIQNFSILFDPPELKHLYITFKKMTSPRLTIALGDQNPSEIRETLLRYCDEDLTQDEEPLMDVIGKVLKL